jgi:hypothetical protein
MDQKALIRPAPPASIHEVSPQKVDPSYDLEHLVDQSSFWNGVTLPLKSDGGPTAGDLDLRKPAVSMGSQTNVARPDTRRPDAHHATVPVSSDMDANVPQQPHETPLPSTSSARLAPSSSGDVPSANSRRLHLSKRSLVPCLFCFGRRAPY